MIDVEAMFLNATLDEMLFMEWAKEMVSLGYLLQEQANLYCDWASRAMYGAVQSPQSWFKTLTKCLR